MKLKAHTYITDTDGIVFNAESGDNFIVNKTGQVVLSLLYANKTEEEIIDTLTIEYQIDKATAKADITDFFSLLKLYDLVEHE